MAILSKKLFSDIKLIYMKEYGLHVSLIDVTGHMQEKGREIWNIAGIRHRIGYALQESISIGDYNIFDLVPGITSCVMALEHNQMIRGGLIGGEVLCDDSALISGKTTLKDALLSAGMRAEVTDSVIADIPICSRARIEQAAEYLKELFYKKSGWKPILIEENRIKYLQRKQFEQSILDQKDRGRSSLYIFDQERALLASIRTGERNAALRILNDMLAAIYLSSPKFVVLRARAIELLSCLTRAAIEDNPMMEPLIEKNHAWTENLITSKSFEALSNILTAALDEFIDGIYLQGFNRSNEKVRRAVEFINENYMRNITVKEIAASVNLSVFRLSHLVKKHTGKTMVRIIHEVRVRHAQELLLKTSMNCTDVCYEVGFADQSYFIKQFKRITGITPIRYKHGGVA